MASDVGRRFESRRGYGDAFGDRLDVPSNQEIDPSSANSVFPAFALANRGLMSGYVH